MTRRGASRRRAAAPIILGALLTLGLPLGSARGHAYPEVQEPSEGAVLASAPGEVKILFDADVEPPFTLLTVEGSNGQAVHRGRHQVEGTRTLRVAVDAARPGRYTVKWRVLATDGHVTEGSYSFTVGP